MAIPISEYIDIKTSFVASGTGERDFSGLVFSFTGMKSEVPSEYAAVKSDYDAGKSVKMSSADFAECFATGTTLAAFVGKYFAYTGEPRYIYLAKILEAEETGGNPLMEAYSRVVDDNPNFGSFTFLGDSENEIDSASELAVATAIAESGFAYVKALTSDEVNATYAAYKGLTAVHCVLDVDTVIQAEEASAYEEFDSTKAYPAGSKVKVTTQGTAVYYTNAADVAAGAFNAGDWTAASPRTEALTANIGAWMPMAWYGSVNYQQTNVTGCIDYKTFAGSEATCNSLAAKTRLDAMMINYIGRVQVYGLARQFYQCGVNMDGEDFGVFRDRMWLKARIEYEWFALLDDIKKVPANNEGVSKVLAIVIAAAADGLKNGAILAGKTLNETQKKSVNTYAGVSTAATQVETGGYYANAWLSLAENNRYQCNYILIYSKGDHIAKVGGSHYLV